MIHGRDIVCLSFVTWDDHWGTPQQIMSRLANNGNRVLFVDQPVSAFSFFTGTRGNDNVWRQLKRWRGGQRSVASNVTAAAPPPIFPWRYNRLVSKVNAWILRTWLRRQITKAGFRDVIFWNFQPSFPNVGPRLDPKLTVYHCVDDFSAVPFWWVPTGGVQSLEERCCRESDIVICTGEKLVASRLAYNPNTHFVPEGADIELFGTAMEESTRCPDDLGADGRTVVGYIGVIDFRLDVELVAYLAKARPDWWFVLVGPVKEGTVDLSTLRSLPNVGLLGHRPIEELPAYLKGMDVCLIPYVLNDYTHHIFPLKLYEYMAAGKPIVATDMEEMRPYAGRAMSIATSNEAFLQAVEEAVRSDSPSEREARRALASGESWESRALAISRIITPVLERNGTSARVASEASP